MTKLLNKIPDEYLLEDTNYKDKLLKYCQCTYKTQPVYKLLSSITDFKAEVLISEKCAGEGSGSTKKEAEQMCAKNALTIFGVKI